MLVNGLGTTTDQYISNLAFNMGISVAELRTRLPNFAPPSDNTPYVQGSILIPAIQTGGIVSGSNPYGNADAALYAADNPIVPAIQPVVQATVAVAPIVQTQAVQQQQVATNGGTGTGTTPVVTTPIVSDSGTLFGYPTWMVLGGGLLALFLLKKEL